MSATAKQNRLLTQENVKLHNECNERGKVICELVRILSGLTTHVVRCYDDGVLKDKDIASLTHLLAIYTNADSPSGMDPLGHEATKAFLAAARAYEAAKEGAGEVVETAEEAENNVEEVAEGDEEPAKEVPEKVQPKPCGGRPGHKGVSHSIKSSRTILYTAEICDGCGRTDLELLPPINKLSVNLDKINWAEEENKEPKKEDRKDAYTARIIFGWCGPCRRLIDPAPHLTWGTWLRGMALAATIQFKSNPLGRATIIDNLGTMHKFWISAGATTNAITALANKLEGRTLPPSVIAWVKAKMEAETDSVDKSDTPPVQEATVQEATVQEATVQEATVQEATVQEATVQEATVQEATVQEATVQEATVQEATVQEATVQEATVQEATVQEATVQEATVQEGPEDNPPDDTTVPEATAPSPAHPTLPPKTTRRMTKRERKAREKEVPHSMTPQGITDAFLTCNTTSYPGSHALSFLEQCREKLTMAAHMGLDESKTVVAGKWCHAIVARSPDVVMIVVRPHKDTKTINWMFGGMSHVCVIHDRIVIYNGFMGMHQECWAHLIRRFRRLAMKPGVGSPEYDRYVAIQALYKRSTDLAERVAAAIGTPSNAAEMAASQHKLESMWNLFEYEFDSIMTGLQGLVKDLDGREPGRYLEKMISRALTFVKRPGTPGTNNGTEGAIRWHVIRPRHVFGSLPNWRAARNYHVIQTFAATCRKNGVSPVPCRAGQGTGSRLGRIHVQGMPAHIPAHGLKYTLCDRPGFAGRIQILHTRGRKPARVFAARFFGKKRSNTCYQYGIKIIM